MVVDVDISYSDALAYWWGFSIIPYGCGLLVLLFVAVSLSYPVSKFWMKLLWGVGASVVVVPAYLFLPPLGLGDVVQRESVAVQVNEFYGLTGEPFMLGGENVEVLYENPGEVMVLKDTVETNMVDGVPVAEGDVWYGLFDEDTGRVSLFRSDASKVEVVELTRAG